MLWLVVSCRDLHPLSKSDCPQESHLSQNGTIWQTKGITNPFISDFCGYFLPQKKQCIGWRDGICWFTTPAPAAGSAEQIASPIPSVIQPQGGAANLSSPPRPLVAMVFHTVSEQTRSLWCLTPDLCNQCVFLSPLFACISPPCVFHTVYSAHRTNRICQTSVYFCFLLGIFQYLHFWWWSR